MWIFGLGLRWGGCYKGYKPVGEGVIKEVVYTKVFEGKMVETFLSCHKRQLEH